MEITSPVITTADAARAARVTAKALRAWLGYPSVVLQCDAERTAGKHRRLSPLDVVRLACIGRLTGFGFTIDEAVAALGRTVDRQTYGLANCGHGLCWPILLSRLDGCVFALDRTGTVRTADSFITLDAGAIAADVRERLQKDHSK